MVTIELDSGQARLAAVHYIANYMVMYKQYFSVERLKLFKGMVQELSSLIEQESIMQRYNNAWPNDMQWGDI